MIDPISIYTAGQALSVINAEVTGMTLAQAWENQGFVDPVDAGFGVDFGVKNRTVGDDKPAISGDTSGTISDNSETVPVDAWHDYVENEVTQVSGVTGGVVDGSSASTFNYSLLKTDNGTVVGVMPIAVDLEQSYIAISQALGVSMRAAEMEVETKRRFADSIISGGDKIYDAARNLAIAWWDGVNILFPKKTVEAVKEVIDELGISPGEGVATDPLYPDYHVRVQADGGSYYLMEDLDEEAHIRGGIGLNVGGDLFVVSTQPGTFSYDFWGVNGRTVATENKLHTSVNGRDIYWGRCGSASILRDSQVPSPSWRDGGEPCEWNPCFYIALYGNVVSGEYPEGTSRSSAQSYDISDFPASGGIALNDTDLEEVISINLPDDPYDTEGSTVDPISATDPDVVDDLPPAPLPLPIPDTRPSNPDVPIVNPSVVDSTLVDQLVEELANTLDPQPAQSSGIIPVPDLPGIGDPPTFPSIIPTSGPGFIHVYNPTPAEFVAFGTWLWVTYADATVDKILNNPFDGVIGAHELYATPNTDGTDNIRSAFLTCPTTAALVPNRYSEIDCGTVIIPEFYGNYLDYSPYSQAYIYLPFIGINEVSIDDIVGHAVNIRYRVDSYSGSCIAMIFVAKDDYQNLCYQFAGSCSVEVPMAGGSQAAIKAGEMQAEAYSRAGIANAALNGAAAIGSGLASGGLAGGLLGGLSALGGIAGAWYSGQRSIDAARIANKSTVQHSGQFGASHGAMSKKEPFIIIRNPIQVKVTNYNEDYGFPAHKRVIVGGCRGYLRVREVNVVSAHATDEEKMAIEAALKNGVYVS